MSGMRQRIAAVVSTCVALFGLVVFSAGPAAADSGPSPRDGDWSCSAMVDVWEYEVCPYLAPGTYTFENTTPTDDGVSVWVCPNSGAVCNSLSAGFCPMPHPTDQCGPITVDSDQLIGIQGANWLTPEYVSFSAVPAS
jgi:hypothetical protein